jgi:hypothetical protein
VCVAGGERDEERQSGEPGRERATERPGLQRDELHVHGRPDHHERELRGDRQTGEAGRDERVGLGADAQQHGEHGHDGYRQPRRATGEP